MQRILTAVLVIFTLLSCTQSSNSTNGEILVIRGATLIIGDGTRPLDNQVVLVKEGRIAQISDADSYTPPTNAKVIDAKGKWLIPGLADMHVHVSGGSPLSRQIFRTMLGFGITTARNNSSAGTNGIEAKEMLESGQLIGPRLFVAGPLLDAPNGFWNYAAVVETEQEVREEVRRQAKLGVDFIKFYVDLSPELVKVGIEEAHTQGLKTIGHLEQTSWSEAADFGIDSLVHSGIYGPTWELSSDSVDRKSYQAVHLQPSVDLVTSLDLAGPTANALVKKLAEHAVVVDPNLVMTEAVYWGDDPNFLDQLEPQYAPADMARSWLGQVNPITSGFSEEQLGNLKKTFPAILEFVKMMHDSGVILVSGTDLMNPWMTPGVALHRELELLNKAGISNLDVLTIASHNAALALGELESFGTIEIGKYADMLVLNADPLLDIRNTRKIDWVIREGIIYSVGDLLSRE